jgi:YD repeat-containing protein
MRNVIPLLAVLCLVLACQKQEKLSPPTSLTTVSTASNCRILSGPYYYKTYNSDGSIDSLFSGAISFFDPFYFAGIVKYDSNHVYLIMYPTDTMFTAELNSQHQVISTTYAPYTNLWGTAHYYYDPAGRLTSVVRNPGTSDDISLHYDSLGNVLKITSASDSTYGLFYTYDYSTPIAKSDYIAHPWGTVWADLMLLQQLSLLDIAPHHKVTHLKGNLYPEIDRDFTQQVMDSRGNVVFYRTSYYNGSGEFYCFFNILCI